MGTIQGSLALMQLPTLLWWIEKGSLSGTLFIRRRDVERWLCFQDGRIIFANSTREGERLGEFIACTGALPGERLAELLAESQQLEVPFIGHLLARQVFGKRVLEEILSSLVVEMLSDALEWQQGDFEFTDELSRAVLNGPVRLQISGVLQRAYSRIEARACAMQGDSAMLS